MKRLTRWMSSPDGVFLVLIGGLLLGGLNAVPQLDNQGRVDNPGLFALGIAIALISIFEAIAIGVGVGIFPRFFPKMWDKNGKRIDSDSSAFEVHVRVTTPRRGPLEFFSKTPERILAIAWVTALPPSIDAATRISSQKTSGGSLLIARMELFMVGLALVLALTTSMWRLKVNWGRAWTVERIRRRKLSQIGNIELLQKIVEREITKFWRIDIRLPLAGGIGALLFGSLCISSVDGGTQWIPGVTLVLLGLPMVLASHFESQRLSRLRVLLTSVKTHAEQVETDRQLELGRIAAAQEIAARESEERLRIEREEFERSEIRRKGLIPQTRIAQLGLHLPRVPGGSEEFEECVRDWLIAWGDTNVYVTPRSRDGGYDVYSDRCIAECKYWTDKPVGRPEVQQLKGAATLFPNCWPLFFAWIGGYSAEAIEWANGAGVALYAFNRSLEIEPINHLATEYRNLLLDLY